MTIDSWQPTTAMDHHLSDLEAPDGDALDPGTDLTAAPVTAIGSDPVAELKNDPAAAAGDTAATQAVRLMFRDDRPYALGLAPDWRSRVPSMMLGLTLTDQLARHHIDAAAATGLDGCRTLASSSMPVAVARETQLRLAELQDDVLAQLPAMVDAPGETITSAHHTVGVTVSAGRVVMIDIDPDWAETATSMAIIEAVGDALGRGHALIDCVDDRGDPLGLAQRELADISNALDDWERG